MTTFDVRGPHRVDVYRRVGGRMIRAEEGATFFGQHQAIAQQRGCYIFAVRAGGGITPIYVGRTRRSFSEECFAPHKLAKYNQALVEYARGTPVFLFLTSPRQRGAPNRAHIGELEKFLIQTGVGVNPELLNVQGTRLADWAIRGVLRGPRGRPSDSAALFRTMMRLRAGAA